MWLTGSLGERGTVVFCILYHPKWYIPKMQLECLLKDRLYLNDPLYRIKECGEDLGQLSAECRAGLGPGGLQSVENM